MRKSVWYRAGMREPHTSPAVKAERAAEPAEPVPATSDHETEQEAGGDPPAQDLRIADETLIAQRPVTEDAAPVGSSEWIAPVLAGLAVAGWTGFFLWANRAATAGDASAGEWSSLIVDWSIPVLLVIVLWLLALRHSRREAARFTDAARELASESAALETRLVTVNRELSLARDFIAAQSRDLESLGRVAAERLSANAESLQGLIRENGGEIESFARVSETALGNLDRVREQLPVIANAARDMTSQIGNAGNVAREQLDELVEGLDRLNQTGEASTGSVTALHAKLTEALVAIEARAADLDKLAQDRFEQLRLDSEKFAMELDAREQDNLSAIRRRAAELGKELSAQDIAMRNRAGEGLDALHERIATLREDSARLSAELERAQYDSAQGWADAANGLEQRMRGAIARIAETDEAAMANANARLVALREEAERVDGASTERLRVFEQEIARRREDAAQRNGAALAAFEQQLAAFDRRLTERCEGQLAHLSELGERGEALAARMTEIDRQIVDLSHQGETASSALGEAASDLAVRLSTSRELLAESAESFEHLTGESVRLLELIRFSAAHTAEDLPQALSAAHDRLAEFEGRTADLREAISGAEAKGAALAAHVERAREGSSGTMETLDALGPRLASIEAQSDALAEKSRSVLAEAIAGLEGAADTLLAKLRDGQEAALRELSDSIGTRGYEAIDKALRENAQSAIAELEKAAREAGRAGSETVEKLRGQMVAVNELADNLEARVAEARARAEDEVDHHFSHQLAQITEALKASAIDVSRVFEADVPDKAWSSYLRGDRGVFARRAVRLLSSENAGQIHQMYEADGEFRESVNRYIRDFEAMLRTVLGTREGHPIAVTLLSSDMGKLYVALAQATERLRN